MTKMPDTGYNDLQTLIATLNNMVVSIGNLNKSIVNSTAAIFPQTQGTASSATAGSASLPAAPVGFIEIKLPNGSTAKVAYYNA